MAVRIGINGFGRIGRLAARTFWERAPEFNVSGDLMKIVHINEINGDVETAAHLLKFDSIHGRSNLDIKAKDRIGVGFPGLLE